MIRPALAMCALVVAVPALADEPPPAPTFAAEAKVIALKLKPDIGEDGLAWTEVTLSVSRCVAGPCDPHQLLRVLVPVTQWKSAHGKTMGVVRYEWVDEQKVSRTWLVALRLDDGVQAERFQRESDAALEKSEATTVATR